MSRIIPVPRYDSIVDETGTSSLRFSSFNEDVAEKVNQLNVTGQIINYLGSSIPDGWLDCNGNNVSRKTYSDLFKVIGTTYGAGDGSTTFGLPNITHSVGGVSVTVLIKT